MSFFIGEISIEGNLTKITNSFFEDYSRKMKANQRKVHTSEKNFECIFLNCINNIFINDMSTDLHYNDKNQELLVLGEIRSRNKNPLEIGDLIDSLKNNIFSLFLNFLGDYVLIYIDKKKKDVILIKSPLCSFNLYYLVKEDGNIIFCSELTFFLSKYKYLYLNTEKNIKEYIATYLLNFNNFCKDNTPFENVFCLLNGYITHPFKRKNNTFIWKPHHIKNKEKDFLNLASKLKELLYKSMRNITCRINDGSDVCIMLSGGYDSSTIACILEELLKDKNKKINVKYFHNHYMNFGDELQYVKILAEKYRREIIIKEQQDGNFLLDNFLPLKSYLEPNEQILYSDNEKNDSPQIANIFLNGNGGDHLLLSNAENATGVLEFKNLKEWYLYLKKISRNYDMSLFQTIKKYVFMPYKEKYKYTCIDSIKKLLTDDFKNKYFNMFLKQKSYPKYYKDKLNQYFFECICSGYPFQSFSECDTKVVFPFQDQELVEFCLNLPPYFKYNGEQNRLIHIKAIENIVPLEILNRNSKSSNELSMSEKISENMKIIEDTFNDSILEKYKILKKGTIKTIIKKLEMGCCIEIPMYLKILALEAWIKQKQQEGYRI